MWYGGTDFSLMWLMRSHSSYNDRKGTWTMYTSLRVLGSVLNLVKAPTVNSRLLFPWQFRWAQPPSMPLACGGHVQLRQTDEHCGQVGLTAWDLCWGRIKRNKNWNWNVQRERERVRERGREKDPLEIKDGELYKQIEIKWREGQVKKGQRAKGWEKQRDRGRDSLRESIQNWLCHQIQYKNTWLQSITHSIIISADGNRELSNSHEHGKMMDSVNRVWVYLPEIVNDLDAHAIPSFLNLIESSSC